MERFQTAGRAAAPAKVDVQLTSMIDVVFQLLAFFLVTFRVAAVEGDFQLRLPKADRVPGTCSRTERQTVRVVADAHGDLDVWRLDSRASGNGRSSLPRLRAEALRSVNISREAGQEEPEFELRLDDRLRYEHAHAVIEALGGPELRGVKLRIARGDE
jgi:biopolymer transport protein ExbD